MPISMYQASVPVLTRGLAILSTLIDKGAAHAAEHKLDPASLVNGRLAPDMLPLSGQVQRASDTAKFAVVRLTGEPAPSFADEETTLDQLRERCARTISFLEKVRPDVFEGSEARTISFGGDTKLTAPGDAYLLSFALPNFFFHVTTAYDILRHMGVAIGKRDYLGRFDRA
ncbi:DUF1993 domain-containing protein [Microvirga massiliensis]|uniref:DUF1993 domain-containing protein n=1 Tax=Microvirga massiliensis TaxID=1033741 RepID=UPI00062B30A1|nr:DUF1993 domain-containing protein [Microvirga massiliensis]